MSDNKKNIRKNIRQLRKNAIHYSKSHYIPGAGKISIFDFLRFLWTGIRNESIAIRGSSLAFKFFLSLFPGMIFFVTLLPYLPSASIQQTLMETLESILPEYSFKAFESAFRDLLYQPRFGLLSIVFLLSLFYSVSNMNGILNTFNKSYHLSDKRKFVRKLIVALGLTVLFYTIIILSLGFISFNVTLVSWMSKKDIVGYGFYVEAIKYGRWIILFFMMLTWLSFFYTIGPPHKIRFKFFNQGSLFSSLFFIILSIGFNFFVNHFANYNQIYGALGVILVFFLWLYYTSIILLIGFEINASLYIAPNKKPQIDKANL
jgi:membrane protein